MNFCLDTSAFIDAWERYYSRDVFPSLWEKLEEWLRDGTIGAPEDVYREFEKQSTGVLTWAKPHREHFCALTPEIQTELRAVMSQHPALVDHRRGRSGADPIVIATAKVHGAMLVTGERASGSLKKPRMPDVCDAMGISWCNMLGMLRKQGVKL